MTEPCRTDFDDWLVRTFAEAGSFTLLIVLVKIGEASVSLLRSAHLHVIGDETRWPDMIRLFAGSGADWNGAAFFRADPDGLAEEAVAKQRLASLMRHLREDRSILNRGDFFDADGLRLRLEEIPRRH